MSDAPEPAPRSVIAEVLRLTGPAVLTSVFQTLAFLADRVMLARHSAVSLGSMQICGAVMWSAYSVFFGALIGTVALIARRVGAGELGRAQVVARAGLRLAALLGVGVGLAGCLSAGWVAAAMAPADASGPAIEAAARSYMRVGFFAFPFAFVSTAGALILNASGDTRTTFWIGTLANLVNIAANYVLIFGAELGPLTVPELGAVGAALGTGLNYVVACALTLWVLRRPGCPVRVTSLFGLGGDGGHSPDGGDGPGGDGSEARREILRLSRPAIVERVLVHIGFVAFSAEVAVLGAAGMAANQALLTLESICFLGAEGFGVAAATVVGQFLGRRDPDSSSRGGWFAALACAGALSLCGVGIWLSSPWTLPLFVAPGESGAELIGAASRAMPVLVLAQPMMAIAVVLGHGLRGAGDTRSPVVAAVVGGLIVRVAGAWILAVELGWGLPGIWAASALDWTVRSVILGAVFVRGRWRALEL